MEDTLRVFYMAGFDGAAMVLILVLMEDTLRVLIKLLGMLILQSLNPCFNGRYSQSSLFR